MNEDTQRRASQQPATGGPKPPRRGPRKLLFHRLMTYAGRNPGKPLPAVALKLNAGLDKPLSGGEVEEITGTVEHYRQRWNEPSPEYRARQAAKGYAGGVKSGQERARGAEARRAAVVRLAAAGRDREAIQEELGISRRTYYRHLAA